MEIILRWYKKYIDVTVQIGMASYQLGLQDEQERRELAIVLREAADELMRDLEES
jgi:hypothetical protein